MKYLLVIYLYVAGGSLVYHMPVPGVESCWDPRYYKPAWNAVWKMYREDFHDREIERLHISCKPQEE